MLQIDYFCFSRKKNNVIGPQRSSHLWGNLCLQTFKIQFFKLVKKIPFFLLQSLICFFQTILNIFLWDLHTKITMVYLLSKNIFSIKNIFSVNVMKITLNKYRARQDNDVCRSLQIIVCTVIKAGRQRLTCTIKMQYM